MAVSSTEYLQDITSEGCLLFLAINDLGNSAFTSVLIQELATTVEW